MHIKMTAISGLVSNCTKDDLRQLSNGNSGGVYICLVVPYPLIQVREKFEKKLGKSSCIIWGLSC